MVTLEQEKLELLHDLEEYFQNLRIDDAFRGRKFYQTHPTVMLNRAMQILAKEHEANKLIVNFKQFLTQEQSNAS